MTAPNAQTPTVFEHHFDDLEDELAATRRLLERFPAEHADFKPHEKSMSLAVLASHVATLPNLAVTVLATDDHDMAATPYKPQVGRTAEELVALQAVGGRAVAAFAGTGGARSALPSPVERSLTRR